MIWNRHTMNSMKLVTPLHSLYWSIHTKDESKRGTELTQAFWCHSIFWSLFSWNKMQRNDKFHGNHVKHFWESFWQQTSKFHETRVSRNLTIYLPSAICSDWCMSWYHGCLSICHLILHSLPFLPLHFSLFLAEHWASTEAIEPQNNSPCMLIVCDLVNLVLIPPKAQNVFKILQNLWQKSQILRWLKFVMLAKLSD